MKRLSWKYVAGVIDSDGCIDLQNIYNQRKGIRPRVRIKMATPGKELLEMMKNSYGGYLGYKKSTNENWQDVYSWELVGYKNVCPFLRNIVNHLIIKKEQARLLLWMETNLKGKRVEENVGQVVHEELKLQKRDPHRLSETAQDRVLEMLQSGNLIK